MFGGAGRDSGTEEGLSARQVNRFRGQTDRTVRVCEKPLHGCCFLQNADCVDSICVCVCVLTYANSSRRKRAGVRMTEILSYQPDNLLPGHELLRKWLLWPELMWYTQVLKALQTHTGNYLSADGFTAQENIFPPTWDKYFDTCTVIILLIICFQTFFFSPTCRNVCLWSQRGVQTYHSPCSHLLVKEYTDPLIYLFSCEKSGTITNIHLYKMKFEWVLAISEVMKKGRYCHLENRSTIGRSLSQNLCFMRFFLCVHDIWEKV